MGQMKSRSYRVPGPMGLGQRRKRTYKRTYTIYDFFIQANSTKVFGAFNKTKKKQRKRNKDKEIKMLSKTLPFEIESGLANSTNKKYFHGWIGVTVSKK